MGPAPLLTHEAHRVAVVHHHHGAVLLGEIADARQIGDIAVHGEDAVGDHELEPCVGGLSQFCFEVRQVRVGVTVTAGLAETDAVNDRGMVQGVADDGVLFAHQRFEDAAVGVEATGIKLRVFHAEKAAELGFQLLVEILGAADEAHR